MEKPYTHSIGSYLACMLVAAGIACSSCSPGKFTSPPYIPAGYYDCVEVQALELVTAYYSHYYDRSLAEANFNGKIFILKDVELNERQIEMLSQDNCTWVDMIQCFVVNTEYCTMFKTGDNVDIIGLNTGATPQGSEGLVFTNCYLIPANSLNLPLEGDGPINIPSY